MTHDFNMLCFILSIVGIKKLAKEESDDIQEPDVKKRKVSPFDWFRSAAPDNPAVKKTVPAAAVSVPVEERVLDEIRKCEIEVLLQVVPHLVNLILFSGQVSVQVVFHCCIVLQIATYGDSIIIRRMRKTQRIQCSAHRSGTECSQKQYKHCQLFLRDTKTNC